MVLLWFLKFPVKNKYAFHRRYCEQHWKKTYQNLSQTSEGNVSSGSASWKQQQERIFFQIYPCKGHFYRCSLFSSKTRYCKKKYKGYTVVGTMKIQAINLEYPIFEEITTKALETGLIALYPNGDNINQVGNTVIIGHNYRNGMFFSNLKKLSNGAKIYIKDFRGTTLTYEVYNKFEAAATDKSFYTRDTNGLAEITLSTCTDASNDQRTILFAKQI